jgi:hypothetical protein
MTGILADNDVTGQLVQLVHIWQSPYWQEIWSSFGLVVYTFHELGLTDAAADSMVWARCQERQVLLITGNRNDDGPDSLEATIRTANTPQSLPVITLANPKRVGVDRIYRRQVAEKLLEFLWDMEKHRGIGRLYVP